MKKRILIIQSVILLTVAVAMFTVMSLAWLTNNLNNSLGGFDIKIKEFAALNIDFFRKSDTEATYMPVGKNENLIISIDNEMLLPGEVFYCRMDIENVGANAVDLNVSFTKITYEITVEEAFYALALEELKKDFVVYTAVTQAALPEPESSAFTENDFFAALTNAGKDEFRLVAFHLPVGAKFSVYYRFVLKNSYANEHGALFKFKSAGVAIN